MSAETHVSQKLLRAVYDENDSGALLRLLEILHQHFLRLCPICAEELESFSHEQGPAAPFLPPLEMVGQASVLAGPRISDERRPIGNLIASLRRRPVEERWQILAAAKRLHGRCLVAGLIEESRHHVPDELVEALSWAQLADRLLRELDLGREGVALQVLVIAIQANAHRLRGQLRVAERGFFRCRHIVRRFAVVDPATNAELDSLQASLYIDLHRLDKAQQLLHRAALLFQSIRADDQVARVLIQLGITHEYDGDPAAALEITHEALSYLDPERHRRLFLCAVLSTARCHYAQGDYETALDVIAFDDDLIEAEVACGNTWLDYNLRWLRGRVAAAQGRSEEAERFLVSVRDEAVERGACYDATVIHTELAFVYYRQQRMDEALTHSREALALALSHRLPRQATAVLMVLIDSLRRGKPAAHLLHEASELIERARRSPAMQLSSGGPPVGGEIPEETPCARLQ